MYYSLAEYDALDVITYEEGTDWYTKYLDNIGSNIHVDLEEDNTITEFLDDKGRMIYWLSEDYGKTIITYHEVDSIVISKTLDYVGDRLEETTYNFYESNDDISSKGFSLSLIDYIITSNNYALFFYNGDIIGISESEFQLEKPYMYSIWLKWKDRLGEL